MKKSVCEVCGTPDSCHCDCTRLGIDKKFMALKDALSAAKKVRPCLRDQFAMAALQGALANPADSTNRLRVDDEAIRAYDYADAMLKAREAKDPPA